MPIQLAKYRELYFSEAHEQLATIAAALRCLERAPGERSSFDAASRAAHSLKGMSATMGYDEITAFAHAFEDLLLGVRDRPDGASSTSVYALVRSLDHLNGIVNRLESGQSPDAGATADDMPVNPTPLSRAPGETPSWVRVSADELERIMARTVDLLAGAARLAYADDNSREFVAEAGWREHLAHVQELQSAVWSAQMAPIGNAFERFPQMLHELARAQQKEIRVTIQGGEIQVGRAFSEEVGEPLLHLLRNAVAHGIEPLAERLMAGKDPRGTVSLQACQQGDAVTIEVGDDGRGLDAQQILQAAYDQALISESERRTLGEADAYELIMLPGFSLSHVVTKASGRGVGMDVVRNKVRAMQGTTHIRSRPGLGTTFVLDFPRTLAALQVELVRSAYKIIAVPSTQVNSRMALTADDFERLTNSEIKVSGRLLRLIDLRALFGLPPRSGSDSYGLVAISDRAGVALRVDEFLGKSLWNKPPALDTPAIPLLDLNHLPAL